jgi:hypothetical protein
MNIQTTVSFRLTKNLTFSLACFLLLGTTALAQEWPSFKSTDENFQISLPAEPKQERTTGKSPLGDGHHIYSLNNGGISYTISVSTIEPPPTKKTDINRTLDFARDIVSIVTAGKELTDTDITLEGFPGRLVRIEKDKQIWTLRVYLVKERIYQLMTTEPKAKDPNPAVTKFFDSFKLLHSPE